MQDHTSSNKNNLSVQQWLPGHQAATSSTPSSSSSSSSSSTTTAHLLMDRSRLPSGLEINNNPIMAALSSYTPTSTKETDALLAAELNQLSMVEREQVFHDIHGVAAVTEETLEMITAALLELQQELDIIPPHLKPAYELALHLQQNQKQDQQRRNGRKTHADAGDDEDDGDDRADGDEEEDESVTNPAFRLQFLRAEKFVAKAAAARLVRYMEEKKTLFGQESLTRKIQIHKDFRQEGDLESLECGYLQLLPGRDRAGRAVMIGLLKLKKFRTVENIVSTHHSLM